jgi:hypothetical protein
MNPAQDGVKARDFTLAVLRRIADPVLDALSENRLRARMPIEGPPSQHAFTHLEAISRLMAGIAPWLELGSDPSPEGQLRERYIDLCVRAISNAVDPHSADYMNFSAGHQPLVDAAFLCHGLLRAPARLWGGLDGLTRDRLGQAIKATRAIQPYENNWLLFSAMVEATLWKFTGECDVGPIVTAINKHLLWYKGDGTYGDGPLLHWDYYNSYVIQPMMVDILQICADMRHPLGAHLTLVLQRARRYAGVQERLISPEASFPIMGRSSCYRFGAFQVLSMMALQHQIPDDLSPGGVRAGLTAVVARMVKAPGTFDGDGWLRLGVVGHQPQLAEPYISTGSLYLCAVGLLHLGLPADDPFWTEPDQPWTQKRLWS